jgi:hypothetical protein
MVYVEFMATDDLKDIQQSSQTTYNSIDELPITANSSVDEIFNLAKALTEQLNQVSIQKTTMSESEFFNNYFPLFNDESVKKLTPDEGYDLANRWEQRVDRFKPINIVDDHTQQVLFTLPSMYNQFTTLNECKATAKDLNTGNEVDVTTLPVAFGQTLARSDDNRKKAILTNDLVAASRLAQKGKLEQQINQNDQIVKEFVRKKYESEQALLAPLQNQTTTSSDASSSDIDTSAVDLVWE